MKHVILFMLISGLAPIAIAQEEYLYKERLYVFSIDYDSGVPAQEECVAALKCGFIRSMQHLISSY